MTSLPSTVDVAIIGAGAAGLGAAHALAGSGLSVIVLEARDRLGGRAWTVQASPEVTFDVRRGYGAPIAAYGAPCPVALNCNVTLIDHSDKRIRIETSQGTLIADKVIVTVPTNLIAYEAIRFSPPLPV